MYYTIIINFPQSSKCFWDRIFLLYKSYQCFIHRTTKHFFLLIYNIDFFTIFIDLKLKDR